MRSADVQQGGVFSYIGIEERIPKDHPIRKLRVLVDAALKSMDRTFDALYAKTGRPSIPPERLLRALMERMDYDLLFRWFAGLNIDDPV
jgi:transposase